MKILVRLILAPFILIGLFILALLSTFLYKAFWDWRVEAMCERDGGRVIYEKILLPTEKFKLLLDVSGDIHLPTFRKVKPGDDYARSFDSEILNKGFLGLMIERYRFRVLRLNDNKLIAEKISYARIGGDFPFSVSHRTSFGCPTFGEGSWYREIFTQTQ